MHFFNTEKDLQWQALVDHQLATARTFIDTLFSQLYSDDLFNFSSTQRRVLLIYVPLVDGPIFNVAVNGNQYAFYLSEVFDPSTPQYSNLHLIQLYSQNNDYAVEDVTLLTNSTPVSPNSPISGWVTGSQIHVYYYDINNNVYEQFWDGNKWNPTPISTNASAPPAGPNSGLVGYSVGGNSHVYYYDASNAIYEVYYAGGWKMNNLTSTTQAAPASGSPLVGFVANPNGGPHVYFLTSNLHVCEIFSDNGWKLNDLTAITKAPVAALSSSLAGFSCNSTPRTYCSIANGDVIEIAYINGWGWKDLTQLTSCNPVVPGSAMSGFVLNGNQPRVYYFDSKGGVNELYSNNGTDWQTDTPTQLAGGPQTNEIRALSGSIIGSSNVCYETKGTIWALSWNTSSNSWGSLNLSSVSRSAPNHAIQGVSYGNPKIDGNLTNVEEILNGIQKTNPTKYTIQGRIPIPTWSSPSWKTAIEYHFQGIAPYNGSPNEQSPRFSAISASSKSGYVAMFQGGPDPVVSWVVAVQLPTGLSGYGHAGGIQMLGSLLPVPLEHPSANGVVQCYNITSDKSEPMFLYNILMPSNKASAVATTTYTSSNGQELALLAVYNYKPRYMRFFQAPASAILNSMNPWTQVAYYQGSALDTASQFQCFAMVTQTNTNGSQVVYLLGFREDEELWLYTVNTTPGASFGNLTYVATINGWNGSDWRNGVGLQICNSSTMRIYGTASDPSGDTDDYKFNIYMFA